MLDFLRPYLTQLSSNQQDKIILILNISLIALLTLVILLWLRDFLKKRETISEVKSPSDEELRTNNFFRVLLKGVPFIIGVALVLWFINNLKDSWNEIQTTPSRCLELVQTKFEVKRESNRRFEIRFPLANRCDEEFMIATTKILLFDGQYEDESWIVSFLEDFNPYQTKYLNKEIFVDEDDLNKPFKINVDDIRNYTFYLDGRISTINIIK
jgi:hypothetical protein